MSIEPTWFRQGLYREFAVHRAYLAADARAFHAPASETGDLFTFVSGQKREDANEVGGGYIAHRQIDPPGQPKPLASGTTYEEAVSNARFLHERRQDRGQPALLTIAYVPPRLWADYQSAGDLAFAALAVYGGPLTRQQGIGAGEVAGYEVACDKAESARHDLVVSDLRAIALERARISKAATDARAASDAAQEVARKAEANAHQAKLIADGPAN